MRRGRTLLAIRAGDAQRDRIADIVGQHAPAEIEERGPSAAIEAPRSA